MTKTTIWDMAKKPDFKEEIIAGKNCHDAIYELRLSNRSKWMKKPDRKARRIRPETSILNILYNIGLFRY
ncbi:MAG: hypothetical protein A2X47_05730 [Lentisphaerae bacterium GWF2_38_69]|nr:MAG: hypothetical protein A2X47_05730 [Lentisphaerae bacterium GWF2_38_69]